MPPPDDEDVEAVLVRLVWQLRALAEAEGALPEDEYEGLQQEALQGQLPLRGEARTKQRRVAVRAGFSLHANTAVHGNDREGCRGCVVTPREGRWRSRGCTGFPTGASSTRRSTG